MNERVYSFQDLIKEARRADSYCPRFGEHNDRCGCPKSLVARLADALEKTVRHPELDAAAYREASKS